MISRKQKTNKINVQNTINTEKNSVLIGSYDTNIIENNPIREVSVGNSDFSTDLFNLIAQHNPDLQRSDIEQIAKYTCAHLASKKQVFSAATKNGGESAEPFVPLLPPLPTQKLAEFEGGRGTDPIAFAMEHYGVWIRARVMDWDYLSKIDQSLAKKIKSTCQNNNRRGKDGPKKLLDIFPDAKTARANVDSSYFGLHPQGSRRSI